MPPPQQNLKRATQLGFDALEGQSEDQLRWLGAQGSGHAWRLPVLGDVLEVDISNRRILTSSGRDVGPQWRIIVLHYLAISSQPQQQTPKITFADLPRARSYAGVYQGRVICRLCATAGREAEKLASAAETLGGRATTGGDLAFDFDPFPQLSLRLIWHAGDEEFPPSATMLLPPNVESYLCSEDIVVLSESIVARLTGRPF